MKRLFVNRDAATLVSAYYFFMFLSAGSALPYFALWMSSIDLTDQQIGLIAASPSFAMGLTTVLIGSIADRASDWRSAILWCNWLVVLVITGLFFVDNFYAVFALWMLWGLIMMAKFPIFDAAAIHMARHRGIEFHKMRAWGSFGFIVGVLLGGLVFEILGIKSFIMVLWLLALSRAILAHALPHFRQGMESELSSTTKQPMAIASNAAIADDSVLRRFWFLLVLAGSAMIHASHAYYYTFSAVSWSEAGFSTTLISILWALGVVVEVGLMWRFALLGKKYTARFLLMAAALIAIVRWLVFGLEPDLWVLLIVQPLHGVTFALMFLATVNFIANWTPVKIAAKAQALSATFNTLCMAIATVAAGYLHNSSVISGYWVMAIMCLFGLLLVAISFRFSPPRAAGESVTS